MKPYIYSIMAATFAGTIGVIVKLVDESVHYMTLNFYRAFFGFIFLLAVCPLIDKKTFKVTRKDFNGYFLVGLVLALGMVTFTTANVFAPVQNVVLLGHMTPIFVLIIGYFVLKEKITKPKIIALVGALVGLVIMNPLRLETFSSIGNLLALMSALFFSMLIIGMRKEEETHTVGDVMWFFLVATILLLPFPFIYGLGNIFVPLVLLLVLALGFVATGMQHLFTNYALRFVEAEDSSIISTIVGPIVAITLAVLIIDEPLNFRVLVGGLFLIASGVYLETHNKQIKEEKEELGRKISRGLKK